MSRNDNRWKRTLALTALVGGAALLSDRLLKWRHRATETSDEIHHATTSDGVRVGLFRHKPDSDTPGDPVLLVHGLGVNHYHMDLDEELSLARHLSSRGFDCWCIELRGRGISDVPNDSWNFDDYAQRDVPAAIDLILDETGADGVHWVGHSMGGMLYYAVAGAVDYQNKLTSGVSIGGPFHGRRSGGDRATSNYPFGPAGSGYTALFVPALDILRRLRLPWPVTARWGSVVYPALKHVVPDPIMKIALNPENIADVTLRRAAVRDIARVEAGVLTQFLNWGIERHWIDDSGDLDYRQAVSKIRVPSLLIAGRADNMVPVHNKRSGFKQLSSPIKKLVVAGREDGFREDYSHVDLVYGHHVQEEIFPLIDDWIRNQDPALP